MKTKMTFAMTMVTFMSSFALANELPSTTVEYVEICSHSHLIGYYVIPGSMSFSSYSCYDPNTGLVASTTDSGAKFTYSESQLLQRISALERQLSTLQAQFGISPLDIGDE